MVIIDVRKKSRIVLAVLGPTVHQDFEQDEKELRVEVAQITLLLPVANATAYLRVDFLFPGPLVIWLVHREARPESAHLGVITSPADLGRHGGMEEGSERGVGKFEERMTLGGQIADGERHDRVVELLAGLKVMLHAAQRHAGLAGDTAKARTLAAVAGKTSQRAP